MVEHHFELLRLQVPPEQVEVGKRPGHLARGADPLERHAAKPAQRSLERGTPVLLRHEDGDLVERPPLLPAEHAHLDDVRPARAELPSDLPKRPRPVRHPQSQPKQHAYAPSLALALDTGTQTRCPWRI